MNKRINLLLFLVCLAFSPLLAQRPWVLSQIDIPHPYYYREMYVPQLTTGPSSATWSPDGKSLIYSMGGSLWEQKIDETTATQITDGPGYDYRPDWSPDGSTVVFVRYDNDAMELHLLDLQTGKTTQLTEGGAVNIDPRFSPDGSQMAFVSTKETGNFRIWIGSLNNNTLAAKPLSPERTTAIPRYYYGQPDHQLSPSWSPDGKSLVFVTNPDVLHGSGNIYRTEVNNYNPVLLREEETNWRASPDWSPDGKRIIYSSYLGQQWHQLWMTPADEKGYPIAMGYGDFDATHARWSPDGSKIAYISNEHGNTELYLMDWLTSKKWPLLINEKKYIHPTATVTIKTYHDSKQPTPARLTVRVGDKSYAPDDAWMHGNEVFNREAQKFETYYFHSPGEVKVTVPVGEVKITAWKGFRKANDATVAVKAGEEKEIAFSWAPSTIPSYHGTWKSADVHVHMNYGGHYRNTPEHLALQAKAEDLDIVYNLVVNKEQRIPDIEYFSVDPDNASDEQTLIMHGQEYHTSFWGHMGLLGLTSNYLLPGYVGYTHTGAESPYPSNAVVADIAHDQNGIVGYVHPFETEPDLSQPTSFSLPVDVALGKVDYYEAVGYSDHHISAGVWYKLMNCGFRLTPVGGTDAMANYSSLRGPVGLTRAFVKMEEGDERPLHEKFIEGVKKGKTFASNGPMLGFALDDQEPGGDIALSKKGKLNYKGFVRSSVPIDKLEIIQNGKVVKTITLSGDRTTVDFTGTLNIANSSWVLLRAYSAPNPEVLDIYPYATTNAVFVSVDGQPIHSTESAAYFLTWIDRIEEAASAVTTWNTEAEKVRVMSNIKEARKVFEGRK